MYIMKPHARNKQNGIESNKKIRRLVSKITYTKFFVAFRTRDRCPSRWKSLNILL